MILHIVLVIGTLLSAYNLTADAYQAMPLEQMLQKVENEVAQLTKEYAMLKITYDQTAKAYQNTIDQRDREAWTLQERIRTVIHSSTQENFKKESLYKEKNRLKELYDQELGEYTRRLNDYTALKDKNDEIEKRIKKLRSSIDTLENSIAELQMLEQKNKHEAESEERIFEILKHKTPYEKAAYANNFLQDCISKLQHQVNTLLHQQEKLSYDLHQTLHDNNTLKSSIFSEQEKSVYLEGELRAKEFSIETYIHLDAGTKELLQAFYEWSNSGSNKTALRVRLDAIYAKNAGATLDQLQKARSVSILYENVRMKQAIADEIAEQQKGFCERHPFVATGLMAAILQALAVVFVG